MKNRKSLGCIKENKLMARILENPDLMNAAAQDVWDECFPTLDAKTDINEVRKILKDNTAILVSDFGRITDIVTRYDLINFDDK